MDDPLIVLPYGRDAEDESKLLQRKAARQRGMQGCLFYMVAIALFLAYLAGVASR